MQVSGLPSLGLLGAYLVLIRISKRGRRGPRLRRERSSLEGCLSLVFVVSSSMFLRQVRISVPSSDGLPEGLLAQSFYGWVLVVVPPYSARFNGLPTPVPLRPLKRPGPFCL